MRFFQNSNHNLLPQRFQGLCSQVLLVLLLFGANLATAGPERYDVRTDSGQSVTIRLTNQKREDNAIVAYFPSYGVSTRTNPQGVEVALEPVAKDPKHYRVTKLTSIWDCQKTGNLSACGNLAIPKNGLVLSASGKERDGLFVNFQPGTTVTLKPIYRYDSSYPVSSIDPSEDNNPAGRGFPGLRGENQLVVYTRNYPERFTGTNEFGFEVTACGGRVIAREGANSTIRESEDCQVYSGHGKARAWLLEYALVGSAMSIAPDGKLATATIDDDTYFAQTRELVNDIESIANTSVAPEMTQRLSDLKIARMRGFVSEADDEVLAKVLTLQEELRTLYWRSFPAVFERGKNSQQAVRGVWHRPKETTTDAIRETLKRYKAAGLNTIYLETYLHGQPIFKSKTFEDYHIPQAALPFGAIDGDKDPMATWLDEAHSLGMSVHAWFQTFYAGNVATEKGPGPIITTYPAWANRQWIGVERDVVPASTVESGAYFLDPANPDVRRFLSALIDEVVTRYPVDGFQLDYIRYPASLPKTQSRYHQSTWGYSDFARKDFAERYAEVRAVQVINEFEVRRQEEQRRLRIRMSSKATASEKVSEAKAGLAKGNSVSKDSAPPDKSTLVTQLMAFYDPYELNPEVEGKAWSAWNAYKTEQVDSFVESVTARLHQAHPNIVVSAAIFPDLTESLAKKHQNWSRWLESGWVDAIAPMTLTSSLKTIESDTRVLHEQGKPVLTGIFGPFNGNDASDVLRQVWAASQSGAQGVILFEGSHLTDTMMTALKSGLFRPSEPLLPAKPGH
jgi:uncharacterized lipoprotein YddW (UPF0748 family)